MSLFFKKNNKKIKIYILKFGFKKSSEDNLQKKLQISVKGFH